MSIEDIEKLKRNNYELQEIINNSWDGIGIIDKTTKFIYINNAFVPILGFQKEELLSTNFVSLMKEENRKPFLEILASNTNTTKKFQAESDVICVRKDKKNVYLKITISSMLNKNLYVINTKDITAQISDDEILNDYVLSFHTDLHGTITKVSSAFLNLCAYKKEEVIGKHYSYFAHKDTNSIVYESINKTLQNMQEFSGKVKNRKKDGKAFWVNIKMKPIFNKYGDVTGYTSLMFDITNEITLNDETSLLQEQVNTAQEEIVQKDKLLIQQSKLAIMTETLQRLSHEWRQPLNLISIQAQKLELDYSMELDPTVEHTINTLEKIKKEADTLSKTIEGFQAFLETKDKVEKVYIDEILENSISIFKNGSNCNIKIIKKLENNLEFLTYKDELTAVLVNLLNNAYESIKDSNIEDGQIILKQYNTKNTLYLEVIDNGTGVEKEILHKIFEPYFSTKEQKHGVGLGLYTSKIIIDVHLNGVITIQNNEKGATAKISLPIIKD